MRKLRNDTPAAEMTARELIAVKAMEGLVAADPAGEVGQDIIVEWSCKIADKMIAALNESAGVK
jgi:hypothetical protein